MNKDIFDKIKELVDFSNEIPSENNCEFNTISLNYQLEQIGVKNEIVSGDLLIEDQNGKKLEFIQGEKRQPIGHSWIIAKINGENYIIEGSYLGKFDQGCIIQKVSEPKGPNSFKVNNKNYHYVYRNDGNTFS